MALLEIKNLGKTFHTPMGEIAASISIPFLQLEQGEALLLDGPSGSGKTTVLHMISGLLSADSGSIYFAGEDVASCRLHKEMSGVQIMWAIFFSASICWMN